VGIGHGKIDLRLSSNINAARGHAVQIAVVILCITLAGTLPVHESGRARGIFSEKSASSDSLDSVILHFAGDCTLANHFEDFVGDRFDYPFRHLRLVPQSDVFMVNLENPVTYRGQKVEKEFNFKMNPKYLQVLESARINVVTLANNHILDYGPDGLLDTIRYLDSLGIRHVGAGQNLEEARKPVVSEIKGFRIGFLGYFGEGAFAAGVSRAGVAPRFEALIRSDIQRLRQIEKAAYVVVNFHWGEEKALYPEQWQISLAHRAVDAGADLVVGHHPHVLEGIEKYKNAVIAYSLGNFLFGGNSRHTYDTAVLKVELGRNLRTISLVPIHVEEWQPRVCSGAEGGRVVSSVQKLSERFQKSIF
jgi:poly-gamma-glutamate capsule biosynthesis protein CapA/YwtB (metallophosphatase superfamily)